MECLDCVVSAPLFATDPGIVSRLEMYCPYRGTKNSRTLLRVFRHVTTKVGV
jgi:hypothetical protein